MKKAFIIASSICILSNPLLSANATTTDVTAKNVKTGTTTVPAEDPAKKLSEKDQYAWLDAFTATFDLTTNYVFRGISQTENLPAAQGGLTYTSPFGLYLSLWGSNVKFVDTDATIELDTIAGYSNTIGEHFTYDINYARYNYPSATNLEYNELNTLFNYYFLQAGISYSANVYNSHKSGTYYSGGINYDIPPAYIFNLENMNILALIGHYSLPKAAGNSYDDYNVALSKKIKQYTLTAQWTGTNGKAHNPPYDSDQIIGTVTVDFS